MQNKKPKYMMAGTVSPGMKMTKSAKDANVLRMMADNAAMQRAEAMQTMMAGGMTMLNADADIQQEAECVAGSGDGCLSKRRRRKQKRRNRRRRRG
tara:strand:+ start:1442 stop:1729 length:288 start_codon:yes stop_codon:yes gene_type:complete